jgi:hypothetical protein
VTGGRRREVVGLYGAYQQGQPSPLRELEIQYADYAAWQRRWLQGEVLNRQLAYWRLTKRINSELQKPSITTKKKHPAKYKQKTAFAAGRVELVVNNLKMRASVCLRLSRKCVQSDRRHPERSVNLAALSSAAK